MSSIRCFAQRRLHFLPVLAVLLLGGGAAGASSDDPGKVIAGWVEKVTLLENDQVLKAKLDSGAKTSSINAKDIEMFKRDGKRWVRFTLPAYDDGEKATTLERPLVRRVRIKEHDEPPESRPVVLLKMCFDGRPHKLQFNLTDRSRFIYPVLLGRRFLAGITVIDPEQTFLTQAHCPELNN